MSAPLAELLGEKARYVARSLRLPISPALPSPNLPPDTQWEIAARLPDEGKVAFMQRTVWDLAETGQEIAGEGKHKVLAVPLKTVRESPVLPQPVKNFLVASLSDNNSEEQIVLVKLVTIRRPDSKKPVVAVALTTPNSSAGLLVRGYRHDGRLETQVVADKVQEDADDEHRNVTDYLTQTPSFEVAEALIKFTDAVVLERRNRLLTLEMPEILRNPAILEEKLPYNFARKNESEMIVRQMKQECLHLVLAYGRRTEAGTVELPLKIFGENGLVTASLHFINDYKDYYSLWMKIRDEQLGRVYSLDFCSDLGGFLERFGLGETAKYLGSISFSPERTGQFRQVVDYFKEHYPIEGPEALPSRPPLPFWA